MALNILGEQAPGFEKHDCKGMTSLMETNYKAFQPRAEIFWRKISPQRKCPLLLLSSPLATLIAPLETPV